jgi:hypothetical protein
MSSLRAPVSVPVEIRTAGEPDRRVFRLAAAVGEDGLRLELPAPFDVGRPIEVRFSLPDDDAGALALRAELALAGDDGEGEHGGREVTFIDAPADARFRLHRYIADRLGLPPLP